MSSLLFLSVALILSMILVAVIISRLPSGIKNRLGLSKRANAQLHAVPKLVSISKGRKKRDAHPHRCFGD